MLLLYMSRVQRAVVLELRTITYFLGFFDPKKNYVSNILISVPPISSAIKKDLSFQRQSKNAEVHREYPSSAKNRDGESSPWYSSLRIRCIQIAHIAFRTCFGDLWTRREKYEIGSRQNTREKQAKQYTRQANILFSRKVMTSI